MLTVIRSFMRQIVRISNYPIIQHPAGQVHKQRQAASIACWFKQTGSQPANQPEKPPTPAAAETASHAGSSPGSRAAARAACPAARRAASSAARRGSFGCPCGAGSSLAEKWERERQLNQSSLWQQRELQLWNQLCSQID